MEKQYQESLKEIRSDRDINGLNTSGWSYLEAGIVRSESIALIQSQGLPDLAQKAQVLDSLYTFGKTKLESEKLESYTFEGGQIALKANQVSEQVSTAIPLSSMKDIEYKISTLLVPQIYTKRFNNKVFLEDGSLKVMFVTDRYRQSLDAAAYDNELECFFDKDVALLFSRMIKAMGLELTEILVSALQTDDEKDLSELLHSEIGVLKPNLIVTLGAKATSHFLKSEQRLKEIHGEFYPFNYEYEGKVHRAELMPLFSPTLLQTAPNMKKTAWKDMQKLMLKL